MKEPQMDSKTKLMIAAGVACAVIVAALAGALLGGALGDDDDDDSDVAQVTTTVTAADDDPDPAPNRAAPVVPDPEDEPIGRAEGERVAKAAERIAGGGTATEVDRSDDPGEAYEVEVATAAGEVDVALDADLKRVPNRPYED
jgi:uncharacterized membrane protein YkoI